jgi:2,4-dienoyl-CoA reductase-like NADH-dependent reductase (Old Yellow Enzyme family)
MIFKCIALCGGFHKHPDPAFCFPSPQPNREQEKKMNKQMTPVEIELIQRGFARLAPISDKYGLVGIESGPLPPPNIPAALAPVSVTMK